MMLIIAQLLQLQQSCTKRNNVYNVNMLEFIFAETPFCVLLRVLRTLLALMPPAQITHRPKLLAGPKSAGPYSAKPEIRDSAN